METTAAILTAGIEAIEVYKEISGAAQDNEVPERFLTSLMAIRLHGLLGVTAKPERLYIQIAKDLGLELDAESRRRMTGLSADVALYDDETPVAVIEAKRIDERIGVESVQFDLHKGDACGLSSKLQVFLAVMVCEAKGEYLDGQKALLECKTACEASRCRWVYSEPTLARNGNWYWCFACGSVTACN